MSVSMSDLKANPSKYFELANTMNIIVTRRGKPIGSIGGKKSAKMLAVEALIGSVKFPPEYDDPNYDPDYELLREAAYKDRGLL
jgi:prevent-host-death family protein